MSTLCRQVYIVRAKARWQALTARLRQESEVDVIRNSLPVNVGRYLILFAKFQLAMWSACTFPPAFLRKVSPTSINNSRLGLTYGYDTSFDDYGTSMGGARVRCGDSDDGSRGELHKGATIGGPGERD